MRSFFTLWQALAGRFARALPTAEPSRDENRRRSTRQVTLEQLGIAHWSCHSHF
jgi:hypothetical protein